MALVAFLHKSHLNLLTSLHLFQPPESFEILISTLDSVPHLCQCLLSSLSFTFSFTLTDFQHSLSSWFLLLRYQTRKLQISVLSELGMIGTSICSWTLDDASKKFGLPICCRSYTTHLLSNQITSFLSLYLGYSCIQKAGEPTNALAYLKHNFSMKQCAGHGRVLCRFDLFKMLLLGHLVRMSQWSWGNARTRLIRTVCARSAYHLPGCTQVA